jgi:hypothetical protein
MREKQLETLRKDREAKAAKKPKPEPEPEPKPEPQVPKPGPPVSVAVAKMPKPPRKAREDKAPISASRPLQTLTRAPTNQSLTVV